MERSSWGIAGLVAGDKVYELLDKMCPKDQSVEPFWHSAWRLQHGHALADVSDFRELWLRRVPGQGQENQWVVAVFFHTAPLAFSNRYDDGAAIFSGQEATNLSEISDASTIREIVTQKATPFTTH